MGSCCGEIKVRPLGNSRGRKVAHRCQAAKAEAGAGAGDVGAAAGGKAERAGGCDGAAGEAGAGDASCGCRSPGGQAIGIAGECLVRSRRTSLDADLAVDVEWGGRCGRTNSHIPFAVPSIAA